jgi:ribosomal-protein-alanine N-acetyltransferase
LFRAAGPTDLEALYRFEILCFEEHRFRRDHVEWILRHDHAMTLVEDGPDGVTAATMLLFEGQVCRVLSLAVAPDARRRGIGTQMMQTVEAFCREQGLSTIRLEVSTRNLGAIELYRRLGYRTDGVLYGYYSWGEDAYSMHKSLIPVRAARTARQWAAADHMA